MGAHTPDPPPHPPPFHNTTSGAIEYLEALEAGEHWLDFMAPCRKYGKRANTRYVFVFL